MQDSKDAVKSSHLPDWGALILINIISFVSVATLVLLSMVVDAVFSQLS